MHVKIHGATPISSDSNLCATCRHSTITRGRTLDEELVRCSASHWGSVPIRFKVTACSSYDDVRQPTYMELMEQAWILQPASRKRPAGFVRASDMRREELEEVMTEIRRAENRE